MVRELTVILDAGGKITAAQVRGADGVGRNLALADLPASLAAVNEAALLRGDAKAAELVALQAEHDAALKVQADVCAAVQAEYDDFRARGTYAAQTARQIIANPNISDADSLVQVDGIAAAMLADKKARDLAAADKAAAEAVAYAAALRAA